MEGSGRILRTQRVAIVGIIPGPQETSRNVNSFLDFWDGVWINTPSTGPKFCRLALVFATCDIPASRTLCGFLSFSAKMGCNKCQKEFRRPAFGEKQDFSGFNGDSRTLRTDAEHREQAWAVKKAAMTKRANMV